MSLTSSVRFFEEGVLSSSYICGHRQVDHRPAELEITSSQGGRATLSSKACNASVSGVIIMQILGGLGNQMFQYAMGRSLAINSNQTLKLDISELTSPVGEQTNTPRMFGLDAWNVVVRLAGERQCDALKYENAPVLKRLWRQLQGKSRAFGSSCYRERGMRFDKQMLQVRGDAYMMGFWQSYRYFEECSHVIREEFTPRRDLSPATTAHLTEITAANAVSIHVRRGDYVSNPTANTFHGTCDLQYYRDAIQAVEKRVDEPRFFVFSDDLEWAKVNLDFIAPATFVEFSEPVHDVEEIHLMSRCKHNIIANSSFSWWGAWLNDHPNRIVVAPKRWFRDPKIDTSDLIPPDWLRL